MRRTPLISDKHEDFEHFAVRRAGVGGVGYGTAARFCSCKY
tara:strand:+ start:2230 stop:2352 length:123 start_codon:yes stop_codon:yes gene_type:complete